jgi:hypothetical protein
MPSILTPSDDALAFVRRCLSSGNVYWTYHVNMRFAQRGLATDDVRSAADSFEIIESYPSERVLPSLLLLGWNGLAPLHVVVGLDQAGGNVRVVTAYRPDPAEWSADFRSRRREP